MINRQELDKIILRNGGADWWQPENFAKNTLNLLPPELEVLAIPPSEDKNYNCFIHAFGLSQNPSFIFETQGFVYDTFVKKLMEEKLLIETKSPEDGDYVLYKNIDYPRCLTHIGLIAGSKIISKCAWGPLIKHDLWDVPKSYGDNIFYLKAISSEKFLTLYEKYKDYNIIPPKEN